MKHFRNIRDHMNVPKMFELKNSRIIYCSFERTIYKCRNPTIRGLEYISTLRQVKQNALSSRSLTRYFAQRFLWHYLLWTTRFYSRPQNIFLLGFYPSSYLYFGPHISVLHQNAGFLLTKISLTRRRNEQEGREWCQRLILLYSTSWVQLHFVLCKKGFKIRRRIW